MVRVQWLVVIRTNLYCFFSNDEIKLFNILVISATKGRIVSTSDFAIYSNLFAKIAADNTSDALPWAVLNWLTNVFVLLTDPSEIFNDIELEALLIWLVNPKISSFGNLLLNRYTATERSMAFCQTTKSSNEFILLILRGSLATNHQPLVTSIYNCVALS